MNLSVGALTPRTVSASPYTSSLVKPSDDCIPATTRETPGAKHLTQSRISLTITNCGFTLLCFVAVSHGATENQNKMLRKSVTIPIIPSMRFKI